MKKQTLFFHYFAILFIVISIVACSGKSKEAREKAVTDSIARAKIVADSIKKAEAVVPKYLVIQGTNVNLRVAPNLNALRIRQFKTGDTCEVMEKGNKETINDVADYWYKIKRKTKEGWVFGAFTSLKQPAKSDKQEKLKTSSIKK